MQSSVFDDKVVSAGDEDRKERQWHHKGKAVPYRRRTAGGPPQSTQPPAWPAPVKTRDAAMIRQELIDGRNTMYRLMGHRGSFLTARMQSVTTAVAQLSKVCVPGRTPSQHTALTQSTGASLLMGGGTGGGPQTARPGSRGSALPVPIPGHCESADVL